MDPQERPETGKPAATPVPTQIVGNEEFDPMPQTEDQRRVEQRIFDLADHYSGKLGHVAAGLPADQRRHGRVVHGHERGVRSGTSWSARRKPPSRPPPARCGPRRSSSSTCQTHHVKDSMAGPLMFRSQTGKLGLNPALTGTAPEKDSLHRANYIKEIFFDSDTVMACITGAAIGPPGAYVLSSEEMTVTRDTVNEMAGSRRMLSHGIGTPSQSGLDRGGRTAGTGTED